MSKTYENNYRFCFPNESLWGELVDAQEARDAHAVSQIVAAQHSEIGEGARKTIAVDPDIFETSSPDLFLMEDYKPEDVGLSIEGELELLKDLSGSRDTLLEDLPDSLPESLRLVSWFIRDREVEHYVEGEAFGVSDEEYDWLYSGKAPTRQLSIAGPPRTIRTGRDFCSLVHSDNPMDFAASVISQLESLGIERRNCAAMEDAPGLGRFASGGVPFILGGCGEVLRRVGLISFRTKWEYLTARPTQMMRNAGHKFHSAYPELHPEHPSRNAMHYIAYAALGGYFKWVYNRFKTLPHGNTVGYELDLAVGNFGDGRCWPGVHTRLDHAPFKKRAEALGVRVAREIFGVIAA